MKTLVTTIFSLLIITANADEGAVFGPTDADSLTLQLPSVGAVPSLEDCNCDGEQDKEEDEKEKRKTPLISFSFGVEADGNGDRAVSSYDCSTSPHLTDIANIISVMPTMDHQDFKSYVSANTQHFSAEDKICLANEFAGLGNENYTMADGIGLYNLNEMHSCIQQASLGNYESCRTCAPIHHYSADMIESMGGQCGLMVNQSAGDDYEVSGSTITATGTSSRFMHYVNICKIGGKFHMINYNSNYQLDAMTYQEAVDIANIGLGEGNWAGNQITCMGSGESSIKDCNHVYLSRSTRYQLSKVQEAIEQLDDDRSPIHVALTNLRQEVRVVVPRGTETKRKIQKDGDLQESTVSHGVTAGYERYRGEHFGQAGFIRRSRTTVTDPNSETGPKRESTQDLYMGIVGSYGDGAYQISGGNQGYTSVLVYLDRDDVYHINQNNDFTLRTDFVAGGDLANIYRPGENAGLGQTNVVTLGWAHQFNDALESEVSQQFSIMTDRANIPMPQIGQTTLRLNQTLLPERRSLVLTNSTALHLLHGGFSDETFAFQNTTQLNASDLGPTNLDIGLSADIGYTTESVNGIDIFYDQGFWGEGNLTVTQPIIESGQRSLYLQVDGGLTTGQRPSQFGIDPLTVEANPTRGMINSGYNGFVRLGGQF